MALVTGPCHLVWLFFSDEERLLAHGTPFLFGARFFTSLNRSSLAVHTARDESFCRKFIGEKNKFLQKCNDVWIRAAGKFYIDLILYLFYFSQSKCFLYKLLAKSDELSEKNERFFGIFSSLLIQRVSMLTIINKMCGALQN